MTSDGGGNSDSDGDSDGNVVGGNAAAAAAADTDGAEGGAVRLWLMDSGGNHLEDPSLKYHTFSNDVRAIYIYL